MPPVSPPTLSTAWSVVSIGMDEHEVKVRAAVEAAVAAALQEKEVEMRLAIGSAVAAERAEHARWHCLLR